MERQFISYKHFKTALKKDEPFVLFSTKKTNKL